MDIDIAGAATAAQKVVEDVMKVEPTMASIASMFVPGAAPIVMTVQPMIAMAVPFVEKAPVLPERRVTVHSGDMGYTMGPFFARGAKCPGRSVIPWMNG
jgi:hypothetical protein